MNSSIVYTCTYRVRKARALAMRKVCRERAYRNDSRVRRNEGRHGMPKELAQERKKDFADPAKNSTRWPFQPDRNVNSSLQPTRH